ncbi:alcohol dehydrogenase catalytic domain-containing protein [Micromonospora pisi]|uniref:alcohol dehydrogenase catalytic domain-containing protein n=1 Tax=Micromonospora pisi TaxID=589240 RepID=UPI001FE44D92|nr:alcohol dehydrogenase catalytic domain-containing protein [Micromonospora pisi]
MGVEHRPAASPAPGEVRIAVAYTGICGTDLHIYHGDMDARVGARRGDRTRDVRADSSDRSRFFWRELELLGARFYQRDDMVEAIRLVASGAVPAKQLAHASCRSMTRRRPLRRRREAEES